MRVLVAPDKFKGSLTARAAAAAMADGWHDARPGDEIVIQPVADGGEGTADVICESLGGWWIEQTVQDPLGRPIKARYALIATTGEPPSVTALVEASAASGFLRVKPGERNLPGSSTYGTGELLRHALNESGAARVIVGLGGSATNDGGIGLAAALDYRFLDRHGKSLPPLPQHLDALAKIIPPMAQPWRQRPVIAACDVRNPLLGPRGATRVYGPQKGLTPTQQPVIEAGLRRLADVVADSLGTDFRETPGAGAAGGLGYGLLSFCEATLEPGFGLVSTLLGLEERLEAADLVLTGEGAADAQSLEGKAPHGVAAMARHLGKPAILFAGTILSADEEALRKHFTSIHAMTHGGFTVAECMHDAASILRRTVAEAARRLCMDRLISD